VRASERDAASLRAAGFTVDTVSRHGEWERDTTFRKSLVRGTGSDEVLEIDWAADSSFRFFPIERDAQLGWRLHMFDAATKTIGSISGSKGNITPHSQTLPPTSALARPWHGAD
jgi:hypothetical protein